MSNTAGSLESRLQLDISDWLASAQKAGSVTQTEFDKMQRYVKNVNAQLGELARYAKEAANSPAGLEATAKSLEHVGFASAGAKRELLVLAHEAATGNWSRFGGSLMVVAERANLMELAFSATGLAVGVAGLAVTGFVAEVVMGAIEAQKLQNMLTMTGNAAGQSAASIDAMALALSHITGSTTHGARGAVEAVVGTGLFGPDQVQQVSQAVLMTERVTGQAADEIVKDFARMKEGVAKWAEELNRSMHFISAAQYEQIRSLEDQGHQTEAMSEVMAAYNDRLKDTQHELGFLARAFQSVKQAASGFLDSIASLGKPDTIDDALKAARQRQMRLHVATYSNQSALGLGDWFATPGALEKARAEQDALVARLEQSVKLRDDVAKASADSAKRHQEGIEGSDFARRFQAEASAANKASTEIEKYKAAVDKMRAAGDPNAPTQAQEAAYIRQYMARHQRAHGDNQAKAFIESLQRQVETAGMARSALLEMEAAQKGVSAAAKPYIDDLKAMEQRARDVKIVLADIAHEQASRSAMAEFAQFGNDYAARIDAQTSAIGKTADELERYNAQRALELQLYKALDKGGDPAELYKEYEKALQNANDAITRRKQAQDAYNANPANGVDKAVQNYLQTVQDQAKAAETIVTGGLSRMEDAFVQFAKTGKLNMGSLFSYIEEQFLRMEISKLMASLIGGGSSGNAGIGTAIFDVISGGGMRAPQFANGLSYVPYDNYAAYLHEGERILTKQENQAFARAGGGSGAIHIAQGAVYNIGQGVSRAEVVAGIQQANAQLLQQVRRLNRQDRLQ